MADVGAQPAFVPAALALDPTGVPLAPGAAQLFSSRSDSTPGFVLTVGDNGIVPMHSPFGSTLP